MTDKDVKLVSTEELAEMDAQTQYLSPIFGSYASDVEMPVDKLNHDPIEPRIASEIIREYIGTEGNAHQNLCTFVQTYMEPEAAELMKETLEKNAIDKDEYPMTADLENRCVKIIQNLWHATLMKSLWALRPLVHQRHVCSVVLRHCSAGRHWLRLQGSISIPRIVRTSLSLLAIRFAGRSSAATGTSRCVSFLWRPIISI